MTASKGKNTKPRFCDRYTTRGNGPALHPLALLAMRPPSPSSSSTASVAMRSTSALATDITGTKNKIDTLTKTTLAIAATAILLGGTYQREQRRQLQEQENGIKDGKTISAITSIPESVIYTVDTIATPSVITEHDSTSSLSKNNNNNNSAHGSTGKERTNHHRGLLLDDIIAGIKSIAASSSDAISSHMEPLRRQAVKNQIPSQFHQPRNVMINRMRSVAGRGLHEKYNVEWDTVLGEGAYGSVHPARLALTGEKVALKKISKRYTNSSDFFSETDALLRIYDNGGHPNISGLRDMVG